MIESALLVVGTATAKAVARIWVQSEIGLDISNGLIDRLSSRVPGLTERRRTARQFEDMADRIVQQMMPLIENEYGDLEDNELQAAILGAGAVIESVQSIDSVMLFEIDLEPTALEALVRTQPSMRVRSDLIEGAQLVFDRILTENCSYIVEVALGMPNFNSTALREVLKRETEITERVQEALARIPQPAALQADEDQKYGVRYRRYVSRELDRLELFGITLSENSSRYELSIAYLTLSAAADEETESHRSEFKSPQREAQAGAYAGSESDESESVLRVDDALARAERHLIRGEAGSGKTTLLQWLAVSAARESFNGSLSSWNGLVPFFIQLRRYANKPLPSPSEFLAYSVGLIGDFAPDGWVDRQLLFGRALILVDGVDELPEHQRRAVRDWLNSLIAEYPDCKFVVTTRPPAVPENWLERSEFRIVELLPMSLPDIIAFVQHWYDAARRASGHVPGASATLDGFQIELIRVIRDTPSIRSLATAPLLCAMLCALNRDRRTQLPKDRMELYRIALESLLDRRDVEREISQNDRITLGLREKETLLQDLSYWLVLNEQADVARKDAIERIESRLKYMPSVNASAEQVFTHLLTRSGLIREPVEGRIDFIHRTFQEYLGAARAISEGNVPLLVSKAHDDQWREVIILSAGHASTAVADELLSGLLERGSRSNALRHRLHLLAVACLETAVELSPEVISSVRMALEAALPPRNMTEARAVASAGPVAAPMLAQFDGAYATTAAACVRALCLIGGPSSLDALKSFRLDRRVTVTRELIRGWDYFDRETFAAEILVNSPLDYGRLTVTDDEGLRFAHRIRHLKALTFAAPPSIEGLGSVPNCDLVTDLIIRDGRMVSSIEALADFSKLKTLTISGAHRIVELPQLADSLCEVSLTDCSELVNVSALADLPNLIRLDVFDCPAQMSGLSGSSVASLAIGGSHISLDSGSWLAPLSNLRELSITNLDSENLEGFMLGSNGGCDYLADAPNLKSLNLWWALDVRSLEGLPHGLRALNLLSAQNLRDVENLSHQTEMETLALDGAEYLENFSFLKNMKRLRYLDLERCASFDDLSLIASSHRLQRLLLGGSGISDLSPVERHPFLRHIEIDRCPIQSLQPLMQLQARAWVTMDESLRDLVTDDLASKHRFRFVALR